MDGIPLTERRFAATAIGGAVLMAVIDVVMVATALPAIARDLSISPGSSVLVAAAYQMALAVTLLPMGKFAEKFGIRRIFISSVFIFAVASVASSLAPTLPVLVAARFVQGIGGAGMSGLVNAMLRRIYPIDLLARGVSFNATLVAVALACGPSLAGAILALGSWHWIFLINAPLAGLVLLIASRWIPADEVTASHIDARGVALSAGFFFVLIATLNAATHGFGTGVMACGLAATILTGSIFLRHQRRHRDPLLPLDILKLPPLRFSVATHFAGSAAQIMAYVAIPFLLHDRGRPQAEAGLIFTAWPLAIMLASPLSVRLTRHYALGLLASAGLIAFALGLLALGLMPDRSGMAPIVMAVALCGAGYGFYQAPNIRALVTSVPQERTASASILGALGRVLGQATGTALAAFSFQRWPGDGASITFLMAAGLALLAVASSSFRLSGKNARGCLP